MQHLIVLFIACCAFIIVFKHIAPRLFRGTALNVLNKTGKKLNLRDTTDKIAASLLRSSGCCDCSTACNTPPNEISCESVIKVEEIKRKPD